MPVRLGGGGEASNGGCKYFCSNLLRVHVNSNRRQKKQYLSTKLQIQNVENLLSFSRSLEERRVVMQCALRAANGSRQKYVFENDHYSVNKK